MRIPPPLSDDLLRAFAEGLPAGTKDPVHAELPGNVGRLLAAVGGRACGDLHFLSVSAVEATRARLESSALWNPAWWPFATTATEMYAYDPIGCFGRRPGGVVSFELEHADRWSVIPTLSLWIGALMEVRDRGPNVADLARDWVRVRGQLSLVLVPPMPDEHRFDIPAAVALEIDDRMPYVDFTLFILHALTFGRDPTQALRAIACALDAALPYCELAKLATAPRDDAAMLARTLLVPHLNKHAAAKNVERLVFAFDSMARPSFGVWAGPRARKPKRSDATALGLDCGQPLHDMIDASPVGFSTEAWTYKNATVTFLIREILDAAAPHLPWEHELDIYQESFLVGRCDRDGFVPTPIAIAREQLQLHRKQTTAGLVKMDFPGTLPITIDHPIPSTPAVRLLRHPDGRQWELSIVDESLRVTLVEGTETETFDRPVKTGWEIETFVAAQLRAGFVDVSAASV